MVEIKRKRRIAATIEDEMQEKLMRLKLPRNRSVKLVPAELLLGRPPAESRPRTGTCI